jgi:hypothetical protein
MKKSKPTKRSTGLRPPKKVPLRAQTGENMVEFNSYMITYSNNMAGNLMSTWRAGMTLISCYKDTQFVGSIGFYPDPATAPPSYMDPNGVIVLSYPLSSFNGILALLLHEKPLYLLLVEKDQQNNPLSPPVGAVATATELVGKHDV